MLFGTDLTFKNLIIRCINEVGKYVQGSLPQLIENILRYTPK
jgi:hypothetical protein